MLAAGGHKGRRDGSGTFRAVLFGRTKENRARHQISNADRRALLFLSTPDLKLDHLASPGLHARLSNLYGESTRASVHKYLLRSPSRSCASIPHSITREPIDTICAF